MSRSGQKKSKSSGSSKSPSTKTPPASSSQKLHRTIRYSALGGRVLKPAVQITLKDIHGNALPAPFSGLVDSGADGSMFKLDMLASLGLVMADLQERVGQGMDGPGKFYVWADENDNVKNLRAECLGVPLKLRAQFSKTPFILLGREDFFKVFDVAFHQQKRTFVLDDV